MNGAPVRIKTFELYRIKVALYSTERPALVQGLKLDFSNVDRRIRSRQNYRGYANCINKQWGYLMIIEYCHTILRNLLRPAG